MSEKSQISVTFYVNSVQAALLMTLYDLLQGEVSETVLDNYECLVDDIAAMALYVNRDLVNYRSGGLTGAATKALLDVSRR